MFEFLMERSGMAEVVLRKMATSLGPVKKKLKKVVRGRSKSSISFQRDDTKINLLRHKIESSGIKDGDVVLIHSSLDGLRCLGLSAEEMVDFILDVLKKNTIVFASYPIEPNKKREIYKYDPKKTLCWTGMLPNVFLKREGVIRSEFPYNTLAAKGPLAIDMMKENLKAEVPHGENTPWEFCRQHHAKILFLGTTSRESNTMAIHMIPDVMGKDWPIVGWYEERKYSIRIADATVDKNIKVQKGFWYQYVNEYKNDKVLKDNGCLKDISFDGIPLEVVSDCWLMVDFLVERCKCGKLMYRIPRRFYKQRNGVVNK